LHRHFLPDLNLSLLYLQFAKFFMVNAGSPSQHINIILYFLNFRRNITTDGITHGFCKIYPEKRTKLQASGNGGGNGKKRYFNQRHTARMLELLT